MPENDYCSECGSRILHKPNVDFQRRPDKRGWDVFIWTPDEPMRGMAVFVPDRSREAWRYAAPGVIDVSVSIEATRTFEEPPSA